MTEAVTVFRSPAESMKKFNERLREHCGQLPVTRFEAAVVDGCIVVTLLSEEIEATEADLENAPEGTKVGDLLAAEDPIIVQVCQLSGLSPKDAAHSEKRMDTLFQRSAELSDVSYVVGVALEWVQDLSKAVRDAKGELLTLDGRFYGPEKSELPYILTQRTVTYAIVTELAPEGDDGDGQDDDEGDDDE